MEKLILMVSFKGAVSRNEMCIVLTDLTKNNNHKKCT